MTFTDSRILLKSASMFAQARDSISQIKQQFSDAGLNINPTSDLGQLLEEALAFTNSVHTHYSQRELNRAVIRGQWVDRIARAAQGLRDDPNARSHLWCLKKGSLQPGRRDPSRAKDKLWELELLQAIRAAGVGATLDEPDIAATTTSGPISIACKRIYSARNLESQASRGVSQLSRSNSLRILGLCLDDLLPDFAIIDASDPPNAALFLDAHNSDYLTQHEVQLSAYMETNRLSAVLASTTCPIRTPATTGRISLCTQLTIWVHPASLPNQQAHMEELRAHLCTPLDPAWKKVHLE